MVWNIRSGMASESGVLTGDGTGVKHSIGSGVFDAARCAITSLIDIRLFSQ